MPCHSRFLFVIPAKAGIQRQCTQLIAQGWIPAFAGMTQMAGNGAYSGLMDEKTVPLAGETANLVGVM